MAPPNVILITVDAMGWDALGALGNPDIRTPNLDALAAHGLSFTQATACGQDRANGWVAPLVSQIRKAGYQTGAVGVVGGMEGDYDLWRPSGGDPSHDAHLQWLAAEGVTQPDPVEATHHVNTWIGDQAVRFCQAADEPFFLWASFSLAAEAPFPWRSMYVANDLHLPEGRAANTDERTLRDRLRAHYGAISHIDRQVGRLLATLTARGRTNNLLVFTATRGFEPAPPEGPDDPRPPLGESSLRIPLLFGGLLGQRKGERDPALLSQADLGVTILAALELSTGAMHDSRSFLTQLRHAGVAHRRALAIQGDGGIHAMRTVRYKWIRNEQSNREYLFDLQNDPQERENISDTRQALAIRKMLQGLK